jgi:hypothetical protein
MSYAFSRAWGALKTPQGAIFKAQRCLENFLEDSSSRAWGALRTSQGAIFKARRCLENFL